MSPNNDKKKGGNATNKQHHLYRGGLGDGGYLRQSRLNAQKFPGWNEQELILPTTASNKNPSNHHHHHLKHHDRTTTHLSESSTHEWIVSTFGLVGAMVALLVFFFYLFVELDSKQQQQHSRNHRKKIHSIQAPPHRNTSWTAASTSFHHRDPVLQHRPSRKQTKSSAIPPPPPPPPAVLQHVIPHHVPPPSYTETPPRSRKVLLVPTTTTITTSSNQQHNYPSTPERSSHTVFRTSSSNTAAQPYHSPSFNQATTTALPNNSNNNTISHTPIVGRMNARVLSTASSLDSLVSKEETDDDNNDVEWGTPSMVHQKTITKDDVVVVANSNTIQKSPNKILLSPGTDDVHTLIQTYQQDQTPRVVNRRPPQQQQGDEVPFIPDLLVHRDNHHQQQGLKPPPSTIHVEDLHLQQLMPEEWVATSSSKEEIQSGDPRKGIRHKRQNLTHSTDAASSLGSIDFNELKLIEVIGGGGFGQVWRANWRGTPVAVKVLTGSAQQQRIPRAVLEEFAAEINLLKGMRHPNICLYMGACVNPPNRAIITELAANGSLWDALRLPLNPPYRACDGVSRGNIADANDDEGGWPLVLYRPDPRHGAPPSATGIVTLPPVPPKGSWPWALVKRVSQGAARGMAYLHSGNPPILHRDLKSANILLDESYTAKVCDFGLSRLKAQERSMTGNCGTVQWMAPEVLANTEYNEKADVYSYGIILWEMLSRECPFEGQTPIQCALAVLNRNKRPDIPKWCPQALQTLIRACIKRDPDERPTFPEILEQLEKMP